MGYLPYSGETEAADRAPARGADRALPGRDHLGLRPALPALDRPVPQGRPEDRPLPAADRRARARTSRSPASRSRFGTLIRAQADGDLQTLRSHGLPAVRITRRRHRRDQGAALDHADRIRRPRQDGRQHGPSDRARLRPRGRRLRPERRRRQHRRGARRHRRGLARGARLQARRAAHDLADGAVAATSPSRRSTSSPTCSTRATRSSTAATPTGTTTSGAPKELEPQGHPLRRRRHRPAASGASTSATA